MEHILLSKYDSHKDYYLAITNGEPELYLPLIHRIQHFKNTNLPDKNSRDFTYDEYIGLRPKGAFFSHDDPNVWVKLENNRSQSKFHARGLERGFWVTISTSDDFALYADWKEPLEIEDMKKVVYYFDNLCIDGLVDAEDTLADLEHLIGKCTSVSYS